MIVIIFFYLQKNVYISDPLFTVTFIFRQTTFNFFSET